MGVIMKRIVFYMFFTLLIILFSSCAPAAKGELQSEQTPEQEETIPDEEAVVTDNMVKIEEVEEVLQTVEPKKIDIEDDSKQEILKRIASVTYIIKNGDYLFKLASESGLYVWQIADLNSISNPSLIIVNQPIEIPDEKQDTQRLQGNYYRIDIGDSLYKIAKSFNTTIEDLQKIAGISDPNYIKAGDLIQVR